MADTLTWTAYNSSDNIKKIYFKWAGISVLHNWIDEADYQAAMDEKDAEYDAMVAEKDQAYNDMVSEKDSAYNTMVAQKNAEIAAANARANINVHYWSGTNYNWDGNITSRSWNDYYKLVDNPGNKPMTLGTQLRFDNGTKYVFGWFLPIYWSTKTSNSKTFISPFEYFVINKADGTITRNRWWVNWISISSWTYTSWYRNTENAIPNQWRIEYATEYRAYYWYDNHNSKYPDRQNNIAWYYYIKKDLSAQWYVKANDNISRDQYWIWPDGTSLDWKSISDVVSDYNTNKIGPVSNINVKYNNKLYTPIGYCLAQNSGNSWYWYSTMYYVTN